MPFCNGASQSGSSERERENLQSTTELLSFLSSFPERRCTSLLQGNTLSIPIENILAVFCAVSALILTQFLSSLFVAAAASSDNGNNEEGGSKQGTVLVVPEILCQQTTGRTTDNPHSFDSCDIRG